ncbi:hypothetical protein GQ53DRAFT_753317 [Thozetella sp. PMI_491]|nr:hypothetical protein GQ53DRAFT_753317 [Thozetella sp. PMI_491]
MTALTTLTASIGALKDARGTPHDDELWPLLLFRSLLCAAKLSRPSANTVDAIVAHAPATGQRGGPSQPDSVARVS